MEKVNVETEKCIGCGLCVKACPAKVFDLKQVEDLGSASGKNNGKVSVPIVPQACIECTHCMAVCPTEAISVAGYSISEMKPITPHNISYDSLVFFLNGRRSYRNYLDKPVEREKLEKIMEGMKLSPTGENAQELEYYIIQDPNILEAIRKKIASLFKIPKLLLAIPGVKLLLRLIVGKEEEKRLVLSLNRILDSYAKGTDPFLRGAPVFIIITASRKTAMMHLDAGIAGHQLNLIAESLGLGCCWIGFFVILANIRSKLKKVAQIPKKKCILGAMALGYPEIKYRRECARKPLGIHYI